MGALASAGAADNGKGSNANEEDFIWSHLALPSYLQSLQESDHDAQDDGGALPSGAPPASSSYASGASMEDAAANGTAIWQAIRREAEREAAAEPLLSSFLYASILAHDSFERALAFVLANRLANAVMLPTQLFETFHDVLVAERAVREGALADVAAFKERDPACASYSQALLYYKGYHAIQTHRIAHALWARGQRVMAFALQSRMSEVLAVDIHPAAVLGKGLLLDHGTGVVIGETAVIGDNVSLLQNVTLGGTGKELGDRHPKVSDNVLIGASATVLGNITIGRGAQIAAGSLVLKPVPDHTLVAGSPAREVGSVSGNPARRMQQYCSTLLAYDPSSSSLAPGPPPRVPALPSPEVDAPPEEEAEMLVALTATSLRSADDPSPEAIAAAVEAAAAAVGSGEGGDNGAASAAAAAAAAAAEAARAAAARPALRGLDAAGVEATVDEEDAAKRWPTRREDAEYVI